MSGAISGGLGVFSGIAALHQGEAQADTEQYKANLATQNAQVALQQAQADAAQKAITGDKKIGAQTAAYAAGGVETNQGSPLDVMASSAAASKLDQLNILHAGDVKSTAYLNQAAQDKFNANADLQAGRNEMFTQFISAGLSTYSNSKSGKAGTGGDSLQDDYENSEEGQELSDEASGEFGGEAEAGAAESGAADYSALA